MHGVAVSVNTICRVNKLIRHPLSIASLILWATTASAKFSILSHEPVKNLPEITQHILDAYDALDVDVELVFVPSKRALHKASRELWVDAVLMRVPEFGDAYPEFVMLDTPVWNTSIVAIVNKDSVTTYTLPNLKTFRRIGALRGIIAIEPYVDEKIHVMVETAEQGVALVELDRLDAFIVPITYYQNVIAANPYPSTKIQEEYLKEVTLYHFIRRTHQTLVNPLNEQLKKQFGIGVLSTSNAQ